MAPSTSSKTKPCYTLNAFGFHLRLWSESDVKWAATIHDGKKEITSRFEEDNLTIAKLHLLEDARRRAVLLWPNKDLPTCESLVDSWEPLNMVQP